MSPVVYYIQNYSVPVGSQQGLTCLQASEDPNSVYVSNTPRSSVTRDLQVRPVRHSVDISLQVQSERRRHCNPDICEYRGSGSHSADTHTRSQCVGHLAQSWEHPNSCEPDRPSDDSYSSETCDGQRIQREGHTMHRR